MSESFTQAEILALTRKLRRMARQLAMDESTAQDLAQDALLAAMQEPPDRVRDPDTWYPAILRNLARRRGRSDRARTEREKRAARSESVSDRNPGDVEWVHGLAQAVGALGEPYQEVLRLHYLEERSTVEIAEQLQRPLATVRSQVQRGLAKLRSTLDEQYDSRAAWLAPFALAGRTGPSTAEPAVEPPDAWRSGGGTILGLSRGSFVMVSLLLGLVTAVVVALRADRDRAGPGLELALGEPAPENAPSPAVAPSEAQRSPVTNSPIPPAVKDPEPASPSEQPALVLDVELVDAAGQGIPGAQILVQEASGSDHMAYTTDPGGRVRLRLMEDELHFLDAIFQSGIYITPRVQGFSETLVYQVPAPEDPSRTILLRIPIEAEGYSCSGVVVDPTGKPIQGATVVVRGERQPMLTRMNDGIAVVPKLHPARTDASGSFHYPSLAAGPYHATVSAPGHVSRAVSVYFDSSGKPANITLSPGGTLQGQVLRQDGSPAGGIRVIWPDVFNPMRWREVATTTDATGAYRLEGIPYGSRWVFAQDQDAPARMAKRQVEIQADQPCSWSPTLQSVDPIRVRVVDRNGAPPGRVGLMLSAEAPWRLALLSDDQGRGEFWFYPEGPKRLSIANLTTTSKGQAALHVNGIEPGPAEVVLRLPDRQTGGIQGLVEPLDLQTPPAVTALLTFPGPEEGAVGGEFEQLALAVDPVTGGFEALDLEAGAGMLSFLVEGRGYWEHGAVQLVDGSVLDLGTLRAPALAPLPDAVLAKAEAEVGTGRILLELLVDEPGRLDDLILLGRWTTGELHEVQLLPGEYRYSRVSDGHHLGKFRLP